MINILYLRGGAVKCNKETDTHIAWPSVKRAHCPVEVYGMRSVAPIVRLDAFGSVSLFAW